MKWLFVLLMVFAAPAVAEAQTWTPAPARISPLTPPMFNAAAEYISPGQDEPGYRAWYSGQPYRAARVAGFQQYLTQWGVGYVVPTWQLLRTATDWQKCAAEPFEVPPPEAWRNIVQTLRYVRDHVVPVIGPVEAVSVYRNPVLNACAGGAQESAHRYLSAVDLVPLRATERLTLMRGLCSIHAWQGPAYHVGLGFYKGLRFHIDSTKYRKWGAAMGDERTLGCPQLIGSSHARAVTTAVAGPGAAGSSVSQKK